MSKTGNNPNNHPHSKGSHSHRPVSRRKTAYRLRLTIFLVGAALVLTGAVVLLIPPASSASTADYTVEVTMGGFQPASISIPAGKQVTIKLVNPDSPYHMDGGGVHQFASPELGLDFKVDPKSSKVITIPATKAGTYSFYCDICCGGKENPSMQGKLVVA
ncbi:MAG TPA: cupredoxin domain-containing protein [Chloroflexia bacterium]|nr:cupredoxin domain-containing protein [Chloroflexia bacterium]